jgi:hypothetical protein
LQELISIGLGPVGGLAVRADAAREALGEHGLKRTGDEVGLDAHIDQADGGARGVVGMEGGEDQVTGQGGANRVFGRFEVADLTDEDHVGRLAQDGPAVPSGRSGRPRR